ncbi:MAG: hypothetical protein OQK68_06420 [Sedimenticola sp.]|nr:hypothetical protein [Sedimenticola sp.]
MDTLSTTYNKAIQLDSDFFRHYLKRGAVKTELGDRTGAKQDLNRSLELLPTADAHYLLGQLALQEGDRQQALAHYQVASDAPSVSGKAAATALVRLDLPEHPQKYISIALAVDADGRVLMQLKNSTSVSISGIHIQLGERRATGQVAVRAEYQVPGRLNPGQHMVLKSNVRLANSGSLNRWAGRITRAMIDEQ